MKLKLDHIGYVVKNLEEAKKYFTKSYNFKIITKTIFEKAHGVKLIFLDMGTNTKPALEIIQPINKNSKVYNFLLSNGEGVHHLAYEVNSITKELDNFKKKGFLQISSEIPGAGHNMAKKLWIMGKKKELIELVEKQKYKKFKSRFTK